MHVSGTILYNLYINLTRRIIRFEIAKQNNLFSDLLKMFSFSFKATNQTMDNKSQWLVLNKNYGTGLI